MWPDQLFLLLDKGQGVRCLGLLPTFNFFLKHLGTLVTQEHSVDCHFLRIVHLMTDLSQKYSLACPLSDIRVAQWVKRWPTDLAVSSSSSEADSSQP